jgi:bis(5'-nucleosyl)-tetraphosphatase (symmetrical)
MAELQALLEAIHFDRQQDRLWFAGDLVNRGPHSLEVLRFVKGLGECAITVLGNHDLHLLAMDSRGETLGNKDSTLQSIFEAPDRGELLAWLRHQPLLHHDSTTGYTLVHAGLPPQWDLTLALACAAELEAVLQGPDYQAYFMNMYGNTPDHWQADLAGWERLRYITNALTRIRYITVDGRLELRSKGAPGIQPAGCLPWFVYPQRVNRDLTVVFGHWASLGWYQGEGVFGVDSGCIWGGRLSALCLDDQRCISVPCHEVCHKGDP